MSREKDLAEKIYKARAAKGGIYSLFQEAMTEFPKYNSDNDAADDLTAWVVEQLIEFADGENSLAFNSGDLSKKEYDQLFDALFSYVHDRFPYS